MSHAQVERALDSSANSIGSAPPYRTVSVAGFRELGLRTWYTPDDCLRYVTIEPLCGRQVTFNGIRLVGGFPSLLARELDEHTCSRGLGPFTGGLARAPRHDG